MSALRVDLNMSDEDLLKSWEDPHQGADSTEPYSVPPSPVMTEATPAEVSDEIPPGQPGHWSPSGTGSQVDSGDQAGRGWQHKANGQMPWPTSQIGDGGDDSHAEATGTAKTHWKQDSWYNYDGDTWGGVSYIAGMWGATDYGREAVPEDPVDVAVAKLLAEMQELYKEARRTPASSRLARLRTRRATCQSTR